MSYYEEPPDPFGTIMAVVLLGAIALVSIGSCLGCATTKCPPCVPEREIIEVKVPVPLCEPPPVLPILEYPDWPSLEQGASEDEIKAFYAACVATLNAREMIMLERIRDLEAVLESYR